MSPELNQRLNPELRPEQSALAFDAEEIDARQIAGVDEAGRGPLAGPVMAAAVILDPDRPIDGIADSKTLTEHERDILAVQIRRHALAWSIAWASPAEIDRFNILQATFIAMRRALIGLSVAPACVRIDGNRAPSLDGIGLRCRIETIVRGDATVTAIGAASILAKTTRDSMMIELDVVYPGYGFARHKGYPTPEHYDALKEFGPCPVHRASFEPVRIAARRAARRRRYFELRSPSNASRPD